MDKPSQETSWGTISLVVLFGAIIFFLGISDRTKPLQTKVSTTQSTVTQSITSNQLSSYDNQTVNGSDIINCIRTMAAADMTIVVQTNRDTSGRSYNSSSYNITDITNIDYIEPSVSFKCTISKTSNGTPNMITCVQQ